MNIYKLGSHNFGSLLVKWWCTLRNAFGCSLSPHVHFILFVYHCEFRDRTQIRTWILRYCIFVEGLMLFSQCCLLPLSSV